MVSSQSINRGSFQWGSHKTGGRWGEVVNFNKTVRPFQLLFQRIALNFREFID